MERGFLYNGLNTGAETCHFRSIWFDISPRGSNWQTTHSVTTGVESLWHAWHVGLRDKQKRGLWTLETHWDLAALHLQEPSNTEFCLFPSWTGTLFHPNLFHLLHRSQSTTKKKGWDANKNKLSNRWGLKRGKFLKKWKSVCWARRKKKICLFHRKWTSRRCQSKATTLAACQASLTSHSLLVMPTVTLMSFGFPFVSPQWESDYIFLHGCQCELSA